MSRPPMGRLIGLLSALILSFGGISVRLAVLQVGQAGQLREEAFDQRVHTLALPAARGEILDRWMDPLAISLEARDVYADPRFVRDPVGTAEELAGVLDMRPREVLPSLTEPRSTFEYVARQVDQELAVRVERLGLAGIGLLPVSKRYYPAGPLASQVLGFVGVDGRGLTGLEFAYQRELAGRAGHSTEETDLHGRAISGGVNVLVPPSPGYDLVTTIDPYLQYQAQVALEAAVERNRARGGTVIVMDPANGDILAMVTHPWFDPNRFQHADATSFTNMAVSAAFEPGSVNKVIVTAGAIQEGAVSLRHRFAVPDQISFADEVIHDSHSHPVERMTLGDIVAQSSNVGTVKVAAELGKFRLASYLSRFGFGRPTGVGFPGESGGILPPAERWNPTSMATIPYGQGIAVTPLQMASVYATIANDGTWVRPRLVRGMVDPSGRLQPPGPSATRRVVSPSTARVVTRMLAYAVDHGTGQKARVPGYQVAGKTGTARKPFLDRSGYSGKYVASFIGFLPASEPRVVIAVMLDEPRTVYGGIASAPLFQEVARYAIERLGIGAGDRVPLPPHAQPVG